MTTITERVVRRWFFNGKSYGTKRAAYLKVARLLLWAELTGTTDCDCGGLGCRECAETRYLPEEKWKALFVERFPVADCPKDSRYGYSCTDAGRDFCQHTYGAWLNAKAKELMEAASRKYSCTCVQGAGICESCMEAASA